jgi:hypothetical protein
MYLVPRRQNGVNWKIATEKGERKAGLVMRILHNEAETRSPGRYSTSHHSPERNEYCIETGSENRRREHGYEGREHSRPPPPKGLKKDHDSKEATENLHSKNLYSAVFTLMMRSPSRTPAFAAALSGRPNEGENVRAGISLRLLEQYESKIALLQSTRAVHLDATFS